MPCYEKVHSLGDYGMGGWNFGDGSTSGSNLLSNGAFTTNTTGWTAVNGTITAIAGGQSGKCCQLTRTSEDSQYFYQDLSGLDFGLLYRLTAYVKSGTSGNESFALQMRNADRSIVKNQVTGTSSSTWTNYTLYWRAFHATNVVCLLKNSSTAGTMLFDTVTVYAFDYSVSETIGGCPFCGSKNWK